MASGRLWVMRAGANKVFRLSTNGTVQKSFAEVDLNQACLVFVSPSIWATGDHQDQFYKMTTNGTVQKTFAISSVCIGAAYDGTYLWYTDNNGNDDIHRVTTNGTHNKVFASQRGYPWGVVWYNNTIWEQPRDYYCYKLTTNGTVQKSFQTNALDTSPAGLDTDGTNFWMTGDSQNNVDKFTTNGTAIRTFAAGDNYPYGITWEAVAAAVAAPDVDVYSQTSKSDDDMYLDTTKQGSDMYIDSNTYS